jgi:hypothetical protein
VFTWHEILVHLALLPSLAGGAVLADLSSARTVMLVAPIGYAVAILLILRPRLHRLRPFDAKQDAAPALAAGAAR